MLFFLGEQGLEHRGHALHGGPVLRHPLRRGEAGALPVPRAHGVHGLRRGQAFSRPGCSQDHGARARLLHLFRGKPMMSAGSVAAVCVRVCVQGFLRECLFETPFARGIGGVFLEVWRRFFGGFGGVFGGLLVWSRGFVFLRFGTGLEGWEGGFEGVLQILEGCLRAVLRQFGGSWEAWRGFEGPGRRFGGGFGGFVGYGSRFLWWCACPTAWPDPPSAETAHNHGARARI